MYEFNFPDVSMHLFHLYIKIVLITIWTTRSIILGVDGTHAFTYYRCIIHSMQFPTMYVVCLWIWNSILLRYVENSIKSRPSLLFCNKWHIRQIIFNNYEYGHKSTSIIDINYKISWYLLRTEMPCVRVLLNSNVDVLSLKVWRYFSVFIALLHMTQTSFFYQKIS